MTTHRSTGPSRRRAGRQNRAPTGLPSPAWPWVSRDRAEVLFELCTLATCVPAAPTIIAVVAVHDLPTGWLLVAGMFIGWASDAVCTLFGHAMGLCHARRTAPPPDDHPAPGNAEPRQPGTDRWHDAPLPPHPGMPR